VDHNHKPSIERQTLNISTIKSLFIGFYRRRCSTCTPRSNYWAADRQRLAELWLYTVLRSSRHSCLNGDA